MFTETVRLKWQSYMELPVEPCVPPLDDQLSHFSSLRFLHRLSARSLSFPLDQATSWT